MEAPTPRIVIDTNVLVAARRSSQGASHRLLSLIGAGRFEFYVSTTLLLEYQDVLLRQRRELGLSADEVEGLLDALAYAAARQAVYYRWRGHVRDRGDAHVLELAVAASADRLVTFNKRDFPDAERLFGIGVVTPVEMLRELGAL